MALPKLIRHPFHQLGKEPRRLSHELAAWFTTPLGRRLIASEKQLLDHLVPGCFGYHIVQVSESPENLIANSPIRHPVYISIAHQHIDDCPVLHAEASALPLANHSVDAVLLHHTLDFDTNPHQILREVERVLIPGGAVIIVGFNPWSLWGIARLLRMASQKLPWLGRFISTFRVADWLHLLNFEVQGVESALFTPAVRHVERLQWLEHWGARLWHHWGAFYILVARKREARLTPIKPKTIAPRPKLVTIPLAQRSGGQENKPALKE